MANTNAAQNLDDEAKSRGGSNSGGNFKNDPGRASDAAESRGEAGGQSSNEDQGDMSAQEDMNEDSTAF